MKTRTLVYVLLAASAYTLTSLQVLGQDPSLDQTESIRIDSVVTADQQDGQTTKEMEKSDSENLADLKSKKEKTKAEAKEAQQIERKTHTAARESRNAYRAEKKAQKARLQADKQAKKAARARRISDN